MSLAACGDKAWWSNNDEPELEIFLPDELKHFQLATGLASKSLV
ncbi:hypothetical protein ACFMI8_18955, partial [Acinetobacter baumannii]